MSRIPRAEVRIPRCSAEGKGALRGPRAEPPIARGSGRGASAFRGLRRRARRLRRIGRVNASIAVTVSGTPCGRARGGVSRRAIRAPAAMIGRTANGRVGVGPGLRPSRLPSVRDWRGRRCRRAAPDILRTQGRPGRQPSAGTPRRQMPKSIGRRAWPLASSPQSGSRFLRDFGHDSGDRSLDLRVRQRALPRLQLDTDRNRFRTFGQAVAQVHVEDADV